jgi:hypothetical protein
VCINAQIRDKSRLGIAKDGTDAVTAAIKKAAAIGAEHGRTRTRTVVKALTCFPN